MSVYTVVYYMKYATFFQFLVSYEPLNLAYFCTIAQDICMILAFFRSLKDP